MTTHALPPVVLFDPAVSSANLGDHIISDSCSRELEPIVDGSFVVRVSSHLPVSKYLTYFEEPRYRFVCGSNLLRGRMNARFRQWDVTPGTVRFVTPAILLGVGWWQYGDEPNAYTRWLYRRVLSREHVHSVRDEFTARYLRSMGFDNVLNTSCPTMWRLNEAHCRTVPRDKASRVVTTVTDYSQDPARDRQMLSELVQLYDTVGVWTQGSGDRAYLETLDLPWNRIDIIPPRLGAYDAILDDPDIDYVGTRLHAGIRALQRGRRTLIVGVDNRAAEKHRDFHLGWLPREEIGQLAAIVSGLIETAIRIPEDRIEEWRAQFAELRGATSTT